VAVVAMLVLGVLGLSLALLGGVEVRMSVGETHRTQAETLAEAGLGVGLDAVRAAATAPGAFTAMLASPMLADGVVLGGGRYWARIDNDCVPLVPVAIGQNGCPTITDDNGRAVVTAWATAGAGRARVRAIVSVDHPWLHVCAWARVAGAGRCDQPSVASDSVRLIPADPSDPNGPAAYDSLPTPRVGCSTVDPTVHGSAPAPSCTRPALSGDAIRQNCHGGGQAYAGYFDCALTTPCDLPTCAPARKACVRAGDSRAVSQPTRYVAVTGVPPACPTEGGVRQTGMVFAGDQSLGGVGSPGSGRNVYVLRSGNAGQVRVQGAVFGTLVVEGNGVAGCSGPGRDVVVASPGSLTTVPVNVADQVNGASGGPRPVYGYPLTLVIYDPTLPVPTVAPSYASQGTCTEVGGPGVATVGLVYSSGSLRLLEVTARGGLVAFDVHTQGAIDVSYDAGYGMAAPPPGFDLGPGSRVAILRKSVVHCADYRDESAGATPCP